MAELADAADSKSADRKVVGVRPPLPAPRLQTTYKQNGLSIARGHFAWWLFWWLLVSYFLTLFRIDVANRSHKTAGSVKVAPTPFFALSDALERRISFSF